MRLNKNNKQTAIAIVITMGVVVALFGGCRQHPAQQSVRSISSGQATPVTAPAPIWKPKQTPNKSVALSRYKRIQIGAKVTPLSSQLALHPGKLTAYMGSPSKGIIGLYDGNQTDDPADNIFSVSLDYQPTTNDKVWLTYRLKGVADNSGVACSINDRLAFGGYLVKKDTATKRQRVQLNAAWLQKGNNRIQFGLAENAIYGYRVSDLAVEVEQGTNDMPLAVTSSHVLYNGKAYIHGFVQATGKTTVNIDGTVLAVRDGEFETIISPSNKEQAEVTAKLNGHVYTKTLRFENNVQADALYALSESPIRINKIFEKGKINELKTPDVLLKTDDKALLTTKNISLTALRPIDLPAMDLGMTNVTADKKGFRFLPHGEHFTQSGATVALKYDRTKIPDGYTENDIRSYYFDPNTKHWVALERDTVDKTLCMVVSKTTHFTDMINGVIKTPESPQTEGFAPTLMNDIKAADPASKIEMIAPPTANNQGSANLSYPIELPPARNGISPNLSLSYNSDGGSGWLGEGWDLNVPSITVDTRWGVPRYDALYETETYSMGGAMLATVVDTSSTATLGGASVGHKGVLYQRLTGIADITGVNEGVQFHPVTESGFNRISRLGSAPNSYSWKVVTKDGLTYSYGATSDSKLSGDVTNFQYQATDKTNNLYNSKQTKPTTGVIAEWKLSSVEDQYRNFCRYHYSSETNKIHGSNVSANSVYLSSIEIGRSKVGSDNDTLYQRISFYRKTARQKLSSNGRYGFLTSNSSLLLDSIKIEQILPDKSTSSVRGYKFRYIQGPFNTLLLNKVIQCDSAWSEVANHAFSYYDNVAKSLYSSTEETFKTTSVESGSSIPASESGLPALGGSKGTSSGTSFYVGASASFSLFGLGISAGAGYNYSSSSASSDTKMMMIDINGDGLPDKVYRATYNGANCLCFIPNLGNNGQFGISGIPISGYTGGLSSSESASYTNGWRANVGAGKKDKFGVTIDAGMDWMNGSSQTSTYLSDVNSDGLVDIVSNGVVYFNYISYYDANGTGIPAFTTNSGLTARPILNMKTPRGKAQVLQLSDNFQQTPTPSRALSLDPVSACDSPIKRNALTALREKVDDYAQVPMQDIVRFWEAPYPGDITIATHINYLGDTFIPDLDGVRLAIQTKKEEIWVDSIKPTKDNNFNRVRNTSITRHVDAGQRIYFRLQSGSSLYSDFLEDVVVWQQTITYSDPMVQYYQNGYTDGVYKSSEGSFVSQEYDNVIDSVASVEIWGKFSKPVTQDSIFLRIYASTDSLLSRDSVAMKIKTDTIVGYDNTTYLVGDTSYVKYKIWEPNKIYVPEYIDKEYKLGTEAINDDNFFGSVYGVPKGGLHLRFEISANQNETWDKIIWKPTLNCHNDSTGKDTIFYAGVKYNLYAQNCPYLGYMVQQPGNSSWTRPDKIITSINVNTKKKVNSKYRLYVYSESNNNPIAKKQGYIINGKVDDLFDILWDNSTPYYFVIYIDDKIPADSVTATCQFQISNTKIYSPIVYCRQLASRTQLGHLWRGWGQFQYNTSCGRYAIPIKVDSLSMPSDMSNEAMINKWGINKMCIFTLNHKPYKNSNRWLGTNDNLLISGDTICTGRLNLEQMPTCFSPVVAESTTAPSKVKRQFITASSTPSTILTGEKYEITTAPALTNRSSAITGWGGASVSIGKTGVNLGGNFTHSDGNNVITSAFMDLNGDGFPDYITDSQVEYTNQIGGRDGEVNSLANERSDNNSDSYGFNGGYSSSKSLGDDGGGADNLSAQLSRDLSANIGYSHSTNNTITTTSYIDLNGDGLPDRVYKENGKVYVCINLGYGFSPGVDWGLTDITVTRSTSDAFSGSLSASSGKLMDLIFGSAGKLLDWLNKVGLGVSLGVNTVKTTSYSMCNLVDVNMDGLPDKIYKSQSGKVAVEFNTGNGFSPAFTIEEMEDLFKSVSSSTSANLGLSASFRIFWIIKITLSASGSNGTSTDYTLNQLLDIDGDGYPDIVKASDVANQLADLKVKRSLIGATNKLAAITNPLGGITRLAYTHTQPTCEHPGGKWVMSTVTVNDGIADDGDSLKTNFNYNTGKYDRSEREFLGFAEVVTDNMNPTQTVYRRVRQTYDNSNFYTRGALLSSVVCGMDGTTEKIYSQSTNKYHTYLVSRASDVSNTTNLGKYVLNTTTPDATFTHDNMFLHQYIAYCPPKYNQNTVYEYSGTTQKSLVTSESYSDYNTAVGTHGELTLYKFSDKGNLVEDSTRYNYRTEINYLDKYGMTLFTLPTSITVTGGDGKVYRKTEAVWNDNFANQLSQVRNILAPLDTSITRIGYDQMGNVYQKELPGDHMWYRYLYDAYYHLFPLKVTDRFGYASYMSDYNYKYGVACKHNDENNNVMTTKLDNLGRVLSITGPNELAAGKAYTLQFEYHPEAKNSSGKPMPYAITRHYDPANSSGSTINNIETVTFVDGLGRAIQVKKNGIIGTTPVMIVSGRAKYDAFGRVKAAYYPIAETDNSLKYVFNAAFDSTDSHIPSSRTAYDVLDRVLMTKLPDGTKSEMVYEIDTIKNVNYLKTTVTDALNHSQITYANGSGKTIQTVQRPDSAAIKTNFAYDAIDRLVTVTDTKGKQTLSVYDQLGRRTQVTHPVSGITKFEYDIAGNDTAKQTANMIASGKKIRYYYRYNRLDSIVYPDHSENNVKYVYATADDISGFNLKGRLKSLEDGSGKQEFKYGLQGEVTEVKRTLVIPNQAVATYTTKTAYDSWNRLQSMTYPDGEIVNYTYNTAGLLAGVSSNVNTYVSDIKYDKFEQRTYMKYGNGAETNYTYDAANRRLNNLMVNNTSANLMNNAYTYDAVSNVTKVVNSGSAIATTAGSGIGGAMTHNYQYDNLYRLKSANGTFAGYNGKTANYTLGMGYDDMHNITSKNQNITQNNVQFAGTLNAGYNLSYQYAANSQQISNIADDSYRYATGESQAHTVKTQNFSYDANGNLLSIQAGIKQSDKLFVTNSRKMLWDEENRLLAVSDNGFVSNYWYDAAGERTVKESGDGEGVSVNGVLSGARTGTTNFTAYISPYLVVNNGGNYTKHIYMGGQRITSKASNSGIFSASPVTTDLKSKYDMLTAGIKNRYDSLGVTYKGTPQSGGLVSSNPVATASSYFYHSDHLGSSSLITDQSGDIVQHMEYVPFGEMFIDERKSQSSWTTPYLFSGKERDEETGLLYFGARYQDSKYGIWYSVDPLAEKYPNVSSYVYCHDNPVKFVDPDGRNPFAIAGVAALAAGDYVLISAGVVTIGTVLYLGSDGAVHIREDIKSKLGVMTIAATSIFVSRINATKKAFDSANHTDNAKASTPQQRKEQERQERDATDQQNKTDIYMNKQIENNVNGEMPNGKSPKRDPKDKYGKIIAGGLTATGAICVAEQLFNSDPSKDAHEVQEEKALKKANSNRIVTIHLKLKK